MWLRGGFFVEWAGQGISMLAPNKENLKPSASHNELEFVDPPEGSESESESERSEEEGGGDDVALPNSGLFQSILVGAGPETASQSLPP